MNILLIDVVSLIKTYWYVVVAIAVIVFVLLIFIIKTIKRATKKMKEDAIVNKARKQLEVDQAKVQEEKKKEEIVSDFSQMTESQTEKTIEIQSEDVIVDDATVEKSNITDSKIKEEKSDKKDLSKNIEVPKNSDKTAISATEKVSRPISYRVIFDSENKEWCVKKDGASKVIRRVKTKVEALALAKKFAENQELNLSVQKKDGKFQKKSNY